MTITGNQTTSSDFLRVLLALKKNTMKDMSVADVCIVQSVSGTSAKCTLLSNSKTTIFCEIVNGLSIKQNDVVLVIFTKSDFRQNLKRLKANQPLVENTQETLHSLNYGIVISLIYRKEK